jgi:uncharacterized membrane protein YhaH (DUF805 family)
LRDCRFAFASFIWVSRVGCFFLIGIPLFSSGTRLGYWSGLIIVGAWLTLICAGTLSLFVRRLHDFGLSGYHVIWVAVAQIAAAALSHGPLRMALIALPLAATGWWLLLWPGNTKTNRFGEAPSAQRQSERVLGGN